MIESLAGKERPRNYRVVALDEEFVLFFPEKVQEHQKTRVILQKLRELSSPEFKKTSSHTSDISLEERIVLRTDIIGNIVFRIKSFPVLSPLPRRMPLCDVPVFTPFHPKKGARVIVRAVTENKPQVKVLYNPDPNIDATNPNRLGILLAVDPMLISGLGKIRSDNPSVVDLKPEILPVLKRMRAHLLFPNGLEFESKADPLWLRFFGTLLFYTFYPSDVGEFSYPDPVSTDIAGLAIQTPPDLNLLSQIRVRFTLLPEKNPSDSP